ncbi:ribonuclease H-like domain-containing protein [Cloacibacillus sp. An23]|uniref:ribonuclease H-like domain-containing protein n=1 Tax=Cloacibacillus sp. An23 TaxID=1965591 RepID=UPI000B38BBD8|nr:ribonuclease H-like domain-containing protein [Cloacibacillus sp. An23]OUO93558.1 hypothetical protein B5F39_07635 [Cloacibacillus sp. An23]
MPRPRGRFDSEKFEKTGGAPERNPAPREAALPKELDVAGLPDGEWIARGVYRMERRFRYGSAYGRNVLTPPGESGAALKLWGGSERPVFLDTETTGLSGGTGTYAFLIGLGICAEDCLRVVQLFLAGPAWERSWLEAVENELPHGCGLVTYNGRAFDLPLLLTRYTLARSVPSWRYAPHMDLLMLARHFYRGRLESCSLSSMEKNVLGLRRSGEDVPGSQIPWMYTRFLRDSDASPLRGVFYHNTLDIVSLAVLQRRIAAMASGDCDCAADMVRAGDLWLAKGFEERARETWRAALGFTRDRHAALLRLAETERAAGNYRAAYGYYKESLATERRPVRTLETMAKIEEHRFRRPADALAHAREALRWLERHRIFKDKNWEADRASLLHRIERLERKTARVPGERQGEILSGGEEI